MKKNMKRIFSSLLALALAAVFVTGASETISMLSGEPFAAQVNAAQVMGSDGDYVPPSTDLFPTTPTKKSNPISVKGKTVEISYAKLAKKNQTVARKKAITVSNAQGSVTYKKTSGNKKITVNSKGTITVKKGLKAGSYTVKIAVTASGNSSYKKGSRTASVKIKVGKAANTLTVKGKSVNVDGAAYAASEGAYVIKKAAALKVSNAKGTVTFTKSSGNAAFTVNKKTGAISVKTGLADGTYKVKVKVKAAGNNNFKSGTKTATVTIVITTAESGTDETGTGTGTGEDSGVSENPGV